MTSELSKLELDCLHNRGYWSHENRALREVNSKDYQAHLLIWAQRWLEKEIAKKYERNEIIVGGVCIAIMFVVYLVAVIV